MLILSTAEQCLQAGNASYICIYKQMHLMAQGKIV